MSDEVPIAGKVIQHYQTYTLPLKWKVLGKDKIKPTIVSPPMKRRRVSPKPGPDDKICKKDAVPISENCPPLPVFKKITKSVHQPSLANKLLKKMIKQQRFMSINIQRLRRERQQKQYRK